MSLVWGSPRPDPPLCGHCSVGPRKSNQVATSYAATRPVRGGGRQRWGRGLLLPRVRNAGLSGPAPSHAAVWRGHAGQRAQLVQRPSAVAGQWAGAAGGPPPSGGGGVGGLRPSPGQRFPLLDLGPPDDASQLVLRILNYLNTGSRLIVTPSFEANTGKPLGRCAHVHTSTYYTHTSTCSFEHRGCDGRAHATGLNGQGRGGRRPIIRARGWVEYPESADI